MNRAFTLEEATDICEDFEDLAGTEYGRGDAKCEIDAIVITPATEPAKELFLEEFYATADAEESLGAYTGNEYDVLIISYNLAERGTPIIKDIRTYVNHNGVNYTFPEDTND